MLEDAAPRMSAFSKRKRYSRSHINARRDQIRQVLAMLDEFIDGADAHQSVLRDRLAANVWLPDHLHRLVLDNLAETVRNVTAQRQRLAAVQEQYSRLPLVEDDDGIAPPPVDLPEPAGATDLATR